LKVAFRGDILPDNRNIKVIVFFEVGEGDADGLLVLADAQNREAKHFYLPAVSAVLPAV